MIRPRPRRATLLVPALLLAASLPMRFAAAPVVDGASSQPTPPADELTVDLFADGPRTHLLTTRVAASVPPVLEHRVSTDGGATWSPATPITPSRGVIANPTRNNDPQIVAVGDRVTVLWVTEEAVEGAVGQVESALSLDGGRTWSRGGRVNDRGFTEGWGFMDVAPTAAGRLAAAWIGIRQNGTTQERGLQFATSDDGGRTWQPNGFIDREICECCWNTVSTGWGDSLLALYRDIPRDMALARSTDGGKTWARTGTVGAFGWTINGCPDVGGSVVRGAAPGELFAMVWTGHEVRHGLYVLRSTDHGTTWSEPVRVGHEAAKHADLAFHDGRLVVAYDARVNGAMYVGVATSSDGGRTWVDDGVVSTPGRRATHPRLAASSAGVTAAWTETDVERGEVRVKTRAVGR